MRLFSNESKKLCSKITLNIHVCGLFVIVVHIMSYWIACQCQRHRVIPMQALLVNKVYQKEFTP